MAKFLAAAFFSLLALIAPAHAAPAVGALPGSHGVTEAGAATYSVPLAVPPGTAGMEPKLSLDYSSQGNNGLLGIGWSLGGLSAITRCPVNPAPGISARVSYTPTDRFCLDGQKLVVASGTYGAPGNNHHTEIDTFVRVRPEGAAGSGPASFKVWTKAGLVMEYGVTADSRILAQGRAEVRVWALSKVSDTAGNYFTVNYQQDAANDEYVPARIDYTGNAAAGLTPYNRIDFEYEDRPDSAFGYAAGSRVGLARRLTHVRTYTDDQLVTEYALAYEQAPLTGRSRLVSITRCAGDGGCVAPSLLTWTDGAAPAYASHDKYLGMPPMGPEGRLFAVGDVNGDGRTDAAIMDIDGGTLFALLGRGDGGLDRGPNRIVDDATLNNTRITSYGSPTPTATGARTRSCASSTPGRFASECGTGRDPKRAVSSRTW